MPTAFTRAVKALLCALWGLSALSLRKHTPAASTRAPEPLSAPSDIHPSAYALEPLDDVLDDFDPTQPGDIWTDFLNNPDVIAQGRIHLARCFHLDPARYDHRT